ncbi:hypothetical protein HYC85_008629 [Camellia sinensis]|uniref:Uncharacterized protein n=1 Tax=Camellia sinensis TaxID=4442 RepID=A0A7J7HSD1_CAMSI|nr:hypothetical protein HYC85_008629 [Camellia sinensis]
MSLWWVKNCSAVKEDETMMVGRLSLTLRLGNPFSQKISTSTSHVSFFFSFFPQDMKINYIFIICWHKLRMTVDQSF